MGPNITSKTLTIDPEQGRLYRRTCHYPYQRHISPRNVKRLSGLMQRGVFVQGTPISFCALPDGTSFLVNGNHTLEAIIDCGIPQLLTIMVHEVADMVEVARIYSSFDVHQMRSWQSALHAYGLDQEIPLSCYVMPAVGLIMQDFKYSSDNIEANSSREARFTKMREYREAAVGMANAISGAPNLYRRLCLRRAVLGVALETFRYQAEKAHGFWHGLSHDDGLSKNDPRKTLLLFLLDNKITGPIENYRQSKAVGLAWNAYYRNDELSQLKPGSISSLVVAGTPWGSKKPVEQEEEAKKPGSVPPKASDEKSPFDTGVKFSSEGSTPVTLFRHRKAN